MPLTVCIPYRDRASHLEIILPKLQWLGENLIVVEQADKRPFNRGALANIGFRLCESEFYCVHDVDMIPVFVNYFSENDVTHLATKVQQFGFKMPYPDYLGGVTVFKDTVFADVNGFSNGYWGWGAEDDDMFERLMHFGYKVTRTENTFNSLPHAPEHLKPEAQMNIRQNRERLKYWRNGLNDGFSNTRYEITSDEVTTYRHVKARLL